MAATRCPKCLGLSSSVSATNPGYTAKQPMTSELLSDVIHQYWIMLRAYEQRCLETGDVLGKCAVDNGYKVLNQVTGAGLHPAWHHKPELKL